MQHPSCCLLLRPPLSLRLSLPLQVAVPDLQRAAVTPLLLELPFNRVQGLARLLLLEQLATPEARARWVGGAGLPDV